MRIITSWRRGVLAASALATLGLAAHAQAQYAPYGGGQTQYPPVQSQYAPAQGQYGGYAQQQPVQQTPPQYAAQGAYQGYQGYAPYQQQQPAANSPYAVPHVAMNFQPTGTPSPTPTPAAGSVEQLPMTPPVESVPPGAMQGGAYVPTPTPTPENNYGYGAPAQQGGYESYPQPGYQGAGCQTGGCATGQCNAGYGGCNAQPYGACDYSSYGTMGGCIGKRGGCGYWFGGVYGLLMDRDDANKYPLVFTAPNTPAPGYYPLSNQVVLRTRDADIGFQPGVEFRLGRTFGCGCDSCSCDPCNPCGGCGMSGPRWGLEGVYWQIFKDSATAQYVDQGTLRTYTMMPFSGLEYNNGNGWRPMNDYFDYAPPVADHTAGGDIEVRLNRVYSSFQVQNVEVNLLKLGCCGGGAFGPRYSAASGAANCGGSCGAGYGSSACGGCDGGCDGGLPMCGCGGCCPAGPRYSCTAVCGFRWMQFDERFMYGVDFDNTDNTTYPAPTFGLARSSTDVADSPRGRLNDVAKSQLQLGYGHPLSNPIEEPVVGHGPRPHRDQSRQSRPNRWARAAWNLSDSSAVFGASMAGVRSSNRAGFGAIRRGRSATRFRLSAPNARAFNSSSDVLPLDALGLTM